MLLSGTYVGEGFLDPGLHTFQAADVDMGRWAREQRRHYTPIVDRACRARGNAFETEIAYRCIDNVVVSVVRNRADGQVVSQVL
jgi:hypothetical protein